MVGVGKLQVENVFSLFAMLKFGISADIIKNPIGRLMIIYMLLRNLFAEWPLQSLCWAQFLIVNA